MAALGGQQTGLAEAQHGLADGLRVALLARRQRRGALQRQPGARQIAIVQRHVEKAAGQVRRLTPAALRGTALQTFFEQGSALLRAAELAQRDGPCGIGLHPGAVPAQRRKGLQRGAGQGLGAGHLALAVRELSAAGQAERLHQRLGAALGALQALAGLGVALLLDVGARQITLQLGGDGGAQIRAGQRALDQGHRGAGVALLHRQRTGQAAQLDAQRLLRRGVADQAVGHGPQVDEQLGSAAGLGAMALAQFGQALGGTGRVCG